MSNPKKSTVYTTKYNKGNALLMAHASRAVYKKEKETILNYLQNPINDAGLELSDVHIYEDNQSFSALIECKECLIWAFRGTDDLKDWLDNLDMRDTEGALGEVHKGFKRALDRVWDDMLATAKEIQRNNGRRPAFITGHSLGGAMASLAAARFASMDRAFTSCYTFGSPRAFSPEAAAKFNALAKERVFRFQNNNDPVTRIPLRLMGFSHVGTFRYIDDKKKICDDPGFWYQFIDQVKSAADTVIKEIKNGVSISDLGACIQDHDMANYIEAVNKSCK